ncbi:MAG: protein kinase [Planctomycetaceae bacterium]|jgi:serine/threonine protein kinase|nr:protein kinase [Planctomycetaceae bacterium]
MSIHNGDRSQTNDVDVFAVQELSTFSPGYLLGENFRLEKRLGRGGMGEAWKAYDETADRFVVLKFIPKEIQHVQEAMNLVRSSFKKVHALQHQHICPVYGLFSDPQHGLYLVMKYIDGIQLDTYRRIYAKKNGKILFSDIVQIFWRIAKGLDYAHEKKVIHRDIKPQNIMIGKSDGVQIIDFGLAEEIRTSIVRFSHEPQMTVSGTRSYMAPEQWRGRLQDARTDQYALAVTAYEMFSGHVPFSGSDTGILRECVLNEDPEPIIELPEYVNTALFKALSKKREDRYENCRAFIKAMITKPQESENAETNTEDISLDETNTQQSSVLNLSLDHPTNTVQKKTWFPKTVFSLSEFSSVAQKTKTQVKKIKLFGFILMVIAGMILIFSVGLFLMQKIHEPVITPLLSLAEQPMENTTVSHEKTEEKQTIEPSMTKPINVEPLTVEPLKIESSELEPPKMELPKIEQNIVELKQSVDNLPEENVTDEKTSAEKPVKNETDGKELLKITEFKNGYLPLFSPQKRDFQWIWHSPETPNSEILSTLSNQVNAFRIEVHKKIWERYWIPSLSYKHFPLIKGRIYRIECELRATVPKQIYVYIENQNKPDVKKYHLLEKIVVETNWKTFQHDFLIHESEPTCSLFFDHFNPGAIYEIRHVSLREMSINSEPSIAELIDVVIKQNYPNILSILNTTEPVEVTESRQHLEKEVEQLKKIYQEALEEEINLAKKNEESNRSLKLAAELKHHVSEKGLKPTTYEPDKRKLSMEKIYYKNKVNSALNSYKKSLTELVKIFAQTNRTEESKITQEMIEHIDLPEVITARLLKRKRVPVLRLILEITEDKNVCFRIKQGLASDPPDSRIQGNPFNMSAFSHALAFQGDNGLGRIVWDFQDPISTWYDSGWVEGRTNLVHKLHPGIDIDKNKGLLLFYPKLYSEEKQPGLLINRYVKYPIRLCCDYIEKQDGTLLTSINIGETEKLGFYVHNSVSNGTLQFVGGINWWSKPMVHKTIFLSQLPFEHTFQLPEKYHFKSSYSLCMCKSGTNGSATRFDVIAKFFAWVGFTVIQQENLLIVENVSEKSPAQRAGLRTGDVIVRMNGKIRTEKDAKEILNSSVFGDLIVLTVVRNNERKVIRFHAE